MRVTVKSEAGRTIGRAPHLTNRYARQDRGNSMTRRVKNDDWTAKSCLLPGILAGTCSGQRAGRFIVAPASMAP
jgi:hypothetical protein